MRNRKTVLLPNKAVFKRSDPIIGKNPLEKASKKKILSSVSLQQNLEFFQRQGNFSRPIVTGGDADTYFRHTLRNYDSFDFSLFQKVTQFYKPSKSSESLKKKKSIPSLKQRKHLFLKPPTKTLSVTTNSRRVSVQGSEEKAPLVLKKETEEVDLDIFYSPSSQTLTSAKNSTHTLIYQSEAYAAEVEAPSEEHEETKGDAVNESGERTEINMAEEEDFAEEINEDEEETGPKVVVVEVEFLEEGIEEGEKEEEEDVEGGEEEEEEEDEEGEDEEDEGAEEENPDGEDKDPGDGKEQGDTSSIFKFDPNIDSAVLKELEEAENQAKITAKIIFELKKRVTELLKKEKHTEAEARELEQKNRELKTQMQQFEEKTKRIQCLLAQTNLFDKMIPPDTPLQTRHNEDILPKVLVCGITENNIPKLILCDEKKGRETCKPTCPSVSAKMTRRLTDSLTLQEKLAKENADLEGKRFRLQADLLNKDQTIEFLQRKLCSIQCEMRLISQENSALNGKIQRVAEQKSTGGKAQRKVCGKNKGTCPADVEGRLLEYSETTKVLEKQLVEMENDVKVMQTELTNVQAEREHLEQHKKVVLCPPPCPPCSPCIMPCSDQQLRELREQYCRLQDDFKSKVTEVAGLRTDNEKLKANAKEAENARVALEIKVKELELTIKDAMGSRNKGLVTKEQMIEQEQQLQVAKQRFREAQDELEELRSFLQDQTKQLDDYRNKYLEAQQEVEEQKRKIDILEMDANRVTEQVTLEIQRVKNQFQEKLQELLPLPDILKTTQIKLQEVQQMHLLAERNNEALTQELAIYKKKIQEVADEMAQAETDSQLGAEQKLSIASELEQAKLKIAEVEEENFALKEDLKKYREHLEETDRELQAKLHEIVQLQAQLETVREESARQVSRNKERCETVRRSMQNQICDLERQLAQSRAQARCAQKDRDEIRQKMQMQINNLHENFEDAQMRIRSLQGHVNFLKESYNYKGVAESVEVEAELKNDPCVCGREF